VTRSGGRVAVAALNPASPWGLAHRRRLRRPPWDQACLRSPGELDALLAQVPGVAPRVAAGVLHAPAALPGVHRWGPWLERLGGRVAPRRGAFQIRVLGVR